MPRPQHSAMFGQRASSHTVCRLRAVDQLLDVEVAPVRARRAHLHPLGPAWALGDGQRRLHSASLRARAVGSREIRRRTSRGSTCNKALLSKCTLSPLVVPAWHDADERPVQATWLWLTVPRASRAPAAARARRRRRGNVSSQPEDLAERCDRCGLDLVDREGAAELAAHGRERASSSPQAVIHVGERARDRDRR